MKHVFIVTTPEGKARQFVLKGKRIGLGRGEDNGICLDVDAVSLSHLEFRKTDSGYEMEDLGSTNGTRVNGKKIQKTELADGDRILIGETVPAHFLHLEEGESWEPGTAEGSAEDQKEAASFVSMSDRLEKLEANIEEKEGEAARIEAQLEELRDSYQQQLSEYAEASLAMEKLEAEIAEKKQLGDVSKNEISALEESLLQNTQRVKVMGTNLAAQKQEISKLEQSESVASGDKRVAKLATPAAAPRSPKVAAQTPRRPQVPPAAPKGQSLPAAGKGGGPKPPKGSRTVKLVKKPTANAAPAPAMVRKKRP